LLKQWPSKRPEILALAGLIGASFALRLLAGLGRPTLVLIPDEYIYFELSRSLAFDHQPLIRDHLVHLPSLGFPLLVSPLWSFRDPQTVYRLTQALNALVASLAAIPVFLLGRELRLRPSARLGIAALALAIPGLSFSSYVGTDVLGYTLSLCALVAGLRALDRLSPRRVALFLVLAAATSFVRLQYVVLFPVFLVAWLALYPHVLLALRRRHLVAAVSTAAVVLVIPAVVGLSGVLGVYRGLLDFGIKPIGTGRWISIDALVLAYAAGAAIVPGALVGLGAALGRPRWRRERAFALVVLLFSASLLVEAGLFASNLTDGVEERYLVAILPLLGASFTLAVERGRRLAAPALIAATMLLVAFLLFPLTAYDLPDHVQSSPLLQAMLWLQQRYGAGDASLLLVTVAAGLLALGTLTFYVPRLFLPVALAGAVALAGGMSAAATLHTNDRSRATARTFLPRDFDRIDDLVSSPVAVVMSASTPPQLATELMFWNRSIGDPINLPGSERVDGFGHRDAVIAPDGRLMVEGKPWRGPLVIGNYASRASLQDARLVLHSLTSDLWRPAGEARFALMTTGLYFDGWLTPDDFTTVWPDASGRLRGTLAIEITCPFAGAERISVKAPWGVYRRTIAPYSSSTVKVPLRGAGPATISVRSNHFSTLGLGRYTIGRARFRIVRPPTPSNVTAAGNR
jgi:hypothetical protein